MKIGKIFNAFSNQRNPAAWLIEAFGGSTAKSGVKVSVGSVLGLAPVVYATNKISGHVAGMPIEVFRESPDGTKEIIENNVSRLLNKNPCDIMTAFTFREIMMMHCLLAGNGRAYIERNSIGTPIGLIPLLPENVRTMLVGGVKWHLVTQSSGTATDSIPVRLRDGEYYKIPDRDILHVMGTSWNGVWGIHIVDAARDLFGLCQAGQDGASITIANSGRPGLLLEAPQGMFRSAKDAKEFLDAFNEKHSGIENNGRAGMLRDGMKATTLPISATDAQFLQQRNFSREEVALLFGLESILGDNSGQTYKSISERNTAYVTNTLARWFRKWEEEIERKLMPSTGLSCRFNSSKLLAGDPNSLADYTTKLSQSGFTTVNELRELHGYNRVNDEGADMLGYQQAEKIADAEAERAEQTNNIEQPEESDETDE